MAVSNQGGNKAPAEEELGAGGRDRLSPTPSRYKLQALLTGISLEAMREAFDWGPDVGGETVD